MSNVTLNGVEVDAVCRDCGATEGLVWVTDHENFEEFPVCENPQECYERQEEKFGYVLFRIKTQT